MDIKMVIKKNGMTVKEFAEKIRISRPTLDFYIQLYEGGKELPKKRYQIIFDDLFSEENTVKSFEEKLAHYENLFTRDVRLGITDLDTRNADLVSRIHRTMVNDLKSSDFDRSVYLFIHVIISNYKRNEIFRELADYFIELNSIQESDNISLIQKKYYSYFFKVFSELQNNELSLDEKAYNEFLCRKEEIKSERDKKVKKVKEQMHAEITSKISDLIAGYERDGATISKEMMLADLREKLNY